MAKEPNGEKKIEETKMEEKPKKFNPKWLEGLKYHTAEDKIVEKSGRKVHVSSPVERAAKEDDILSWKDYGDKVIIAIKDGKKYTVKK